jgi:hypothetical protein
MVRAVDFRRRHPSAEALAWVERALGDGARIVGCRRMTGGLTAAVHRLTASSTRGRHVAVLRQYEQAASGDPGGRAALAEEVRHEARVLEGARAHGLPDPGAWLRQIAVTAARFHAAAVAAPVAAPAFVTWFDPARMTVPASASCPDLWQTARSVRQEDRAERPARRRGRPERGPLVGPARPRGLRRRLAALHSRPGERPRSRRHRRDDGPGRGGADRRPATPPITSAGGVVGVMHGA